ncbi:hypothetical protein Tco_0053706 [Tanacetum coccineum]
MRTRSQARRRRQPQVRQPSVESPNLEKPNNNQETFNPPIVTMDDNRTMAQLLEAPTEGYEDAIVVMANKTFTKIEEFYVFTVAFVGVFIVGGFKGGFRREMYTSFLPHLFVQIWRRTRLLVFVLSLDEDVVVYASQKAFKSLPNVSKSISELMAIENEGLLLATVSTQDCKRQDEDSAQASLANNMATGDVGTYLVTPPLPAIGGREDVGELHSLGSTT